VLCKGAESAVLKRCVSGPVDITIEHVDYFASVSYYSVSYVESFSHYINLHANLKNVLLHRIIVNHVLNLVIDARKFLQIQL